MYSKAELEAKAQIDLIGIAEQLGISRMKAVNLDTRDLIYRILDRQASAPAADQQPRGHAVNTSSRSSSPSRP